MTARADRVQRVAERYVADGAFSGVEWHVEHRGETLAAGKTGYADAAERTPIPDGAIYRIFSMTKPVVSLLALQLVERGELRLFDFVAQYDERVAAMTVLSADGALEPARRLITVEDLLTHRAGMSYEFIHGCQIAQYYRDARVNADGLCDLDVMMERVAALPLAFHPGDAWRYSVSIDVLAHVIERATGRRLDELLDEHIFAPLGMHDTAFHVPADKQGRLMSIYGRELLGTPALAAVPHVLEPIDVNEMYPLDNPATFRRGGLGLYSTTSDYLAFARMLLDGRAPSGEVVLSRKMLEMARANRLPASQVPIAIGPNVLRGYGWGLVGRVMLDRGAAMSLTSEGEFGWAGAATTFFWSDPAEALCGVFMTQYIGSTLPLADEMRTAAYQAID